MGFHYDGHPIHLINAKKMGIIGIQERTRLVNGKLKIKSEINKGTSVKVEITVRQ